MVYQASPGRYAYMQYRRCGNSGLKLPVLSFGLWHNFGAGDDYEKCRTIIHTAFDSGITHFDLAKYFFDPRSPYGPGHIGQPALLEIIISSR